VLSACPDNNKSNRIIVTTASNRVTNTICQGNGPVYKMRPLDKNSAKHLLGKKSDVSPECRQRSSDDDDLRDM